MGRFSAMLGTRNEKKQDLREQEERYRKRKQADDEISKLPFMQQGPDNDYSDVGGPVQGKPGSNFANSGDPNRRYQATEDAVKGSMRNITGAMADNGRTYNPADDKPLPGDNMSANDYKMFCDSYGIRLSDMVKLPPAKRKAVMSSQNPRYAMQRALGSI